MAHRRRKPALITDRVVRIFEVQVWPHNAAGEPTADGPYEPTTVTLSFQSHKLPTDRYDEKSQRDALKQALKADGWAEDELERGLATHELSSIRLRKQFLIAAADTHEAKRAAVRS